MHDPTEGGLATALQELAFASNVDIVIDKSAVNVLPLCQSICNALGIDPWGLISSGALLATVQSEYADAWLLHYETRASIQTSLAESNHMRTAKREHRFLFEETKPLRQSPHSNVTSWRGISKTIHSSFLV